MESRKQKIICIENKIYEFNYKKQVIKFYLPLLNDWVQKVIHDTKNFYEIGMLEDIKERVGEGKTIVDVGANIGNHTVYFSKVCKAKKVYSFEPQKKIFEILKRNVQLNNDNEEVELFNMGVGEERMFANANVIDKNNYGMTRLDKNVNGTIVINSLDKILFNKSKNIDMIKIDVEGMEIDVLKGAKEILRKFKPLIYIEAGNDEEFKDVSVFLSQYGYKPIVRFNATPTYLFIN